MNSSYEEDKKICKKITKSYGTSYFLSTYFFNKKIREETWVLYAFLRYPDEIVDTEEKDPVEAKEKLESWINDWNRAYNQDDQDVHPILRANAVLWKEKKIPFIYSQDFFKAMLSDTEKYTFLDYKELESYMYGSATVVGYMMSYIIGFKDGALPYARALGEAFQLTNFIRDIKEDFARGRIYIPKEDMDKYEVSQDDFQKNEMTSNMRELVLYEIRRNEELYEKAKKGIELLDKGGQKAVLIALYLYKEILNKIKKDPTRIFRERTRVGKFRKLIIIIKNI